MTYKILLATKEVRKELKTPFEIKFFNDNYMEVKNPWRPDREYLVAVDDENRVLGVMCFVRDSLIGRQVSSGKACIGFAYLSVASFRKGKGIGKALATELFKEADRLKRGVRVTEYEPEGELYLKPVIKRLASEHNYSVYEAFDRIN